MGKVDLRRVWIVKIEINRFRGRAETSLQQNKKQDDAQNAYHAPTHISRMRPMDFTGKKLHCNYLYTISSGITKKNSCLINIASVGGNLNFSIMVLATAVFA
ncbi:MAG: hypothetical protein AB1545_08155 [Thermodesulfobacteriota bacterium]